MSAPVWRPGGSFVQAEPGLHRLSATAVLAYPQISGEQFPLALTNLAFLGPPPTNFVTVLGVFDTQKTTLPPAVWAPAALLVQTARATRGPQAGFPAWGTRALLSGGSPYLETSNTEVPQLSAGSWKLSGGMYSVASQMPWPFPSRAAKE